MAKKNETGKKSGARKKQISFTYFVRTYDVVAKNVDKLI